MSDMARVASLAVEIALEAGALQRRRFNEPHTIETKSSSIDLVTEVDRASEKLIVGRIGDARPRDGILSEETEYEANRVLRGQTAGFNGVYDALGGRRVLEERLEHLNVQGVILSGPCHQGVDHLLVEAFATDWVKRNLNASKRSATNDGARFLFTILAAHADRQLWAAVEQGDPPEAILKAIDLIAEAERQLWANVNLKQVLENLAVQWTQATSRREPFAMANGSS